MKPQPMSESIPAILETERLLLRPPIMDDAQAIFQSYAQSPEVAKYLVWKPHASIHETRQFLSICLSVIQSGSSHPKVVTLRATGEVIGMVDIRVKGPLGDLGYVLAAAHWGKGLASEAVSCLVNTAWKIPTLYRIWATCDVDNKASARVMEKAGMQREGILRRWIVHPNIAETPRDSYCYAKVR
jgi:RimJ/RimL family protein N-acetyltransferase